MKALGASVPLGVREAVDRWVGIQVFDDVLADPDAFRASVLAEPVVSYQDGQKVFRGLRLPTDAHWATVHDLVARYVPGAVVSLTFARQSPLGQREPNDVHSDIGHGSRTAILYLNPEPADGDGTLFWRHQASGLVRGPWDAQCQADSHDRSAWTIWRRVEARYNRLLVFDADLYHSRALVENFGADPESARLIWIAFLADPTVDVGVAHV